MPKGKSRGYSDSYLQELWRLAVKAIWGEACARCGQPHVQCHHIVRRSRSLLRDDPWNGIPLCKPCHDWADTLAGREWVAEQVDMRYLRAREQVNIKDYLRDHGMSRREFDRQQVERLKRVIEQADASAY